MENFAVCVLQATGVHTHVWCVAPLSQIKAVRKATREEKKRKAMALRKKELGALGMHVRETHTHPPLHHNILL